MSDVVGRYESVCCDPVYGKDRDGFITEDEMGGVFNVEWLAGEETTKKKPDRHVPRHV